MCRLMTLPMTNKTVVPTWKWWNKHAQDNWYGIKTMVMWVMITTSFQFLFRCVLTFLPNERIFDMVMNCKSADVLAEIPRRCKANCGFLVDNIENITRKANTHISFCDACSLWDTRQGRSHTPFICSPIKEATNFQQVRQVDNFV